MLGARYCLFGLFFHFYDLFIFTDHLAPRAVVMMSAGVELAGPAADIHADSRDRKEAVEHEIIALYLLLKKVGASLLISGALSDEI